MLKNRLLYFHWKFNNSCPILLCVCLVCLTSVQCLSNKWWINIDFVLLVCNTTIVCLTCVWHGHVSQTEVFLLLSTALHDSQLASLEILINLINMPLLYLGSNLLERNETIFMLCFFNRLKRDSLTSLWYSCTFCVHVRVKSIYCSLKYFLLLFKIYIYILYLSLLIWLRVLHLETHRASYVASLKHDSFNLLIISLCLTYAHLLVCSSSEF